MLKVTVVLAVAVKQDERLALALFYIVELDISHGAGKAVVLLQGTFQWHTATSCAA